MAIQQGTSGAIQQTTSWSFSPSGETETVSYIGDHSTLWGMVGTYRAAGWNGNVTPVAGPKSILTATRIAVASLTTTWELDVQWSTVEAEDSDKFWEYLDGLASDTLRAASIAQIKAAADEIRSEGTYTLFSALPNSTEKSWCLDISVGKGVYQPAAVLRRVNAYPRNTSYVNDWADAGKVWTKAQIDALTSAPSAYVGTLPTGSKWLMTPAGASTDGEGKINFTTHWVMGRYPTHSYTAK